LTPARELMIAAITDYVFMVGSGGIMGGLIDGE
jgi:hypothetical protein